MLSYKYLLLLLTTISIQLVTAKKDEELQSIAILSNHDTRQSLMTWSPTIAPPPNTPFPTYTSNGDNLIPINSLSLPPNIPILSPDLCASNLPCTTEFTQCTDGTTESCCDKTYESFICNCEISFDTAELQWMCYYTDACFIPSCEDGEVVEIAIDDGEVSDALQSTLPVETDAPVSPPVTVEPTTSEPTTAKVSVQLALSVFLLLPNLFLLSSLLSHTYLRLSFFSFLYPFSPLCFIYISLPHRTPQLPSQRHRHQPRLYQQSLQYLNQLKKMNQLQVAFYHLMEVQQLPGQLMVALVE